MNEIQYVLSNKLMNEIQYVLDKNNEFSTIPSQYIIVLQNVFKYIIIIIIIDSL